MSNTARILLVADEPAILDGYSEILKLEGHEVWMASTGQQALELARETKAEIVLLDPTLPGLSATKVCGEIRREPALADTSVVLFFNHAAGGADNLPDAEFCADDYLAKSATREELLARIQTLVRLRNANAAARSNEQSYRQLITETNRKEEQIRMLADAVHSARELICITDNENRFTFVNQAFLETYGYNESEVLGRTPDLLYSARNPPGLCEIVYNQTLRGGWKGEIINRRKDGSEIPISLSTSVITSNSGRHLGLIGVARNISEEKGFAKQAAAFSRLGARLSGAVSPKEAAEIILDVASELFGWDAGYVDLLSREDDTVTHVLMFDTLDGKRQPVRPRSRILEPTPLMRMVLKEGAQFVNCKDKVYARARIVRFGDLTRSSACSMYVPIRSRGETVGLMSIQSYRPGIYSRHDLELLQTLADHCGDALKRIKLAEDLGEAEAKYRGIVENASEGIFRTTPEGRILSANPALARMAGYPSPQELIRSVTDLNRQVYICPEKRVEYRRVLESRGVVQGYEVELYGKDKNRIWVSLNARAVRDASGKVLYYEGTMQDVTERKQVQQRLADAMELNLAILVGSSVGIAAYRASGQCIFANAAAGRIVGTTPERLMQQNFRRLSSWREYGLLRMALEVLRERKNQTREVRVVSTYGRDLWLECHMASFTSGGEPHLLLLMLDATKRKQVEEELRDLPRLIIQAQESERLRAARELHDSVNQLLASAQMRLQRVEQKVTEMAPSAGEILARCRDLLVQALEENRRIAHDLRPSDLDQLGLPIACHNFCKQFGVRTNLKVRCHIPRLRRLAPAVELNLFRIVQEAFNNVHKHARATTVRLRISLLKKALRLRIQDDGCGFPGPAKLQQRSKHGIGLTNMRERAASMGGTCEIESLPNEGTTITVRIPL